MRRQAIADADSTKTDYSALDFSEFMNGSDANKGKLGLFILRVVARQDGAIGGFYKTDGSVIPYPEKKQPAAHNDQGTTMITLRRMIPPTATACWRTAA